MKLSIAVLAATATSASATRQFVVNDYDETSTGSGWGDGWFAPCSDAYGTTPGHLDFHMDWAGKKGEVSVDIRVPLGAGGGGCFLIEEWHPGQNAACARYLPKDAPLTLHLGDGAEETVLVDQSVGGGKWNAVGHFLLGNNGGPHATFSNNGGRLTCDAAECWWAADAWRFTEAADATACDAGGAVHPAAPAAELSATVTKDDCAGFGEELLGVVEVCAGATSCAAPEFAAGHGCREAAAAFGAKHEFRTSRCLMSCMRSKRELVSLGLQVEAALACPESNAADEAEASGVASSSSDAAAAASSAAYLRATTAASDEVAVVAEASEAVEFDGDCSSFKAFAQQVVDACSHVSCCAEVVSDDTCRYYAAGLHALYPSNAINRCIERVKLERQCSCFVRKVSACAVQAEVHEILYDEQWQPTCTAFPAMARQQDPAAASGGAAGGWHTALFAVLGCALVGVVFASCRATASANVAAPPITAEEISAGTVAVVGEIVDNAVEVGSEKEGSGAPAAPAAAVVMVLE